MVLGIESFREKFKDYTDYYTIIGGTACDILLTEADLPFRATKDIDMILIMEDNFPEFVTIFWEYIKEGGYKCGWKKPEACTDKIQPWEHTSFMFSSIIVSGQKNGNRPPKNRSYL